MQATEQMKGLSVLEHGHAVWQKFLQIINKEWDNIRVPKWLDSHFDYLKDNIYDMETIERYAVFHDCGKPYCIEYDEQGRKHFPNHAEVSKNTWLRYHPDDLVVADLIGFDMCMHTETLEQILSHNWPERMRNTLMLIALAEIHANSDMFGGIESTSFKIKWKKLDKRGHQLLRNQ